MRVLAILWIPSLLLVQPDSNVSGLPADVTSFARRVVQQENRAVAFLENEAVWRDESKKKLVRDYVAVVSSIRAPSVAPILAKHLTFSPYDLNVRLRIEKRLPTYKALKRIGLPAVPALLKRIREIDVDLLGITDFERNLQINCLIEIYDQVGVGKQLARRRLALEAAHAMGKEKERLLKALEHDTLR